MSTRVRRNAYILKVLGTAHPSVVKAILKGHNKDLIDCLGECCHNILCGNVPLSKQHKSKLVKYKHQLRKVADRKTTLANKERVVQSGGFLPALLAPLISAVIAPLAKKAIDGIANAIKKKKRNKNHKK